MAESGFSPSRTAARRSLASVRCHTKAFGAMSKLWTAPKNSLVSTAHKPFFSLKRGSFARTVEHFPGQRGHDLRVDEMSFHPIQRVIEVREASARKPPQKMGGHARRPDVIISGGTMPEFPSRGEKS